MINISIESFKLLLNEINQIENKNSLIIIREDALLSKGASNEGMASQDLHLILHLCDTDTENTSLLINNSNISLLSPYYFSSLIDGCLKYKNKEKPKTGPRPDPRLNYDVKIGPIEAQSGRAEMQGSSVPLGRNHVSPSGAPSHHRALRIVLTFPPPYGAPGYKYIPVV